MKYIVLIAAVFLQMCFGSIYSWSVYAQEIKNVLGIQQGPAQIPFTMFYLVFPLVVMVGGRLLSKIGPQLAAMIGGALFGAGWIVASLGAQNFLYTCVGIGVIAGLGAGMAYIVPIAVCVRWFPAHKGLVTGLAVAGFGGGAALVSEIGGTMLTHGEGPFEFFLHMGITFVLLTVAAGMAMRFPKEYESEGGGIASTASEVDKKAESLANEPSFIKDPVFLLLYLCMFACLATGFSVNANLKEIFTGEDALSVGITSVAVFAIANGLGRILWGALFDRLSSINAVSFNLLGLAITMALIPSISTTATGFLCVAALVGFGYGGALVLYVATVTRRWGADRVGQVYGLLFTANLPAACAPILAGMVYDSYGTFAPAWYVLAVLLLVSIACLYPKRAVMS